MKSQHWGKLSTNIKSLQFQLRQSPACVTIEMMFHCKHIMRTCLSCYQITNTNRDENICKKWSSRKKRTRKRDKHNLMVLQSFQSKSILLANHRKIDLLSKYLNLNEMEVDYTKIDCSQPDQEPEMQFETCNAKQ